MQVQRDEPHEHQSVLQQAQQIQRQPSRQTIRASIQQIVTIQYRPLHRTVSFHRMVSIPTGIILKWIYAYQ